MGQPVYWYHSFLEITGSFKIFHEVPVSLIILMETVFFFNLSFLKLTKSIKPQCFEKLKVIDCFQMPGFLMKIRIHI